MALEFGFHPRVKASADLVVAGGVGVDAVVGGVAVDGVEIELGGDKVDVLALTIAELFEHALDEAVLDALPSPTCVVGLIVGHKGLLT